MNVKEAVLAALKELILPELQVIKHEQAEFKATLALTNRRLDDMNAHLVDQSRRIDDTNKRLDAFKDSLEARINEINKRLDRLYEVIVRREEHQDLVSRLNRLETDVEDLKRRLAA